LLHLAYYYSSGARTSRFIFLLSLVLPQCPPEKPEDSADTGAPIASPVDADMDGYYGDTDCDAADVLINPGATERCNGADDDCDGAVDEADASDASTWCADTDGDGYGDGGSSSRGCSQPSGSVSDDTDCDDADADAAVYPGATEHRIGADDDGDGEADDGCLLEHCGVISSDESWASYLAHRVTCDVVVEGSASPALTVESHATVEFDSGTGLYVGWDADGALVTATTFGCISFTSSASSPAAGDWDGLHLGPYDQGSVIDCLTVEYAGGDT